MEDSNRNLGPDEPEDRAPETTDLEALEAELAPVLGEPGRAGRGEPGASSDFRASLKQAFVRGEFAGDEALEPELEDALRSWDAPAASTGSRAAALHALLEGERPVAAPSNTARAGPAETERSQPVHAVPDRAMGQRTRRAPAPARSTSARLRLLVGASLLAAAAAIVLFVRGGTGTPVDDGGASPADQVAATWSLDGESRESFSATAAFDGVFVDGRAVSSIAQLESALASGRKLENGPQILRIRHGDQFVIELDAGAAVELDAPRSGQAGDGMELIADRGSVRVATGPGFDPELPLVVVTPHVRTEVVGTIFGVDVTPEYTCVCCLEGRVHTTPLVGAKSRMDVEEGSTRVLFADGRSMEIELVSHHGRGLAKLEDRTSVTGYWI